MMEESSWLEIDPCACDGTWRHGIDGLDSRTFEPYDNSGFCNDAFIVKILDDYCDYWTLGICSLFYFLPLSFFLTCVDTILMLFWLLFLWDTCPDDGSLAFSTLIWLNLSFNDTDIFISRSAGPPEAFSDDFVGI